ncbi:MAG: hypothetical protein AAGI28_01145 [Pseudomonadota bacterium]
MIARVIWFVILLGAACVTAGVQLDRQVRKTPELAAYVPELFRSASQPRIAALSIDSGIAKDGVTQAQTLVRRRPMPAQHLRLLAQAQFAADEAEASSLTIQYAAQRGWRDRLAQEAMMQLALAAGDRSEATKRFAALFLINGTDRGLLEEAAGEVLGEPGGQERTLYAEIVSGGQRWHSTFLRRGARVLPPDAFVEILEKGIASGAGFRCSDLKQALRLMAGRNKNADGRLTALLNDQC